MARLSSRRMIWLLLHPFPVSKLYRRHTGRLEKERQLANGRGGGGGGGAKFYYNLVHYKSMNTLRSRKCMLLHKKRHGKRNTKEDITFLAVTGIGSNHSTLLSANTAIMFHSFSLSCSRFQRSKKELFFTLIVTYC